MTTIPNGVYFVVNAGTGTVLDLNNGSSTNGTKVHGYKQRALNDSWVPAQLWVIALVGSEGDYTFENANSRTLMDLTNSMRSIPDHILLEECQQYPDSQLP